MALHFIRDDGTEYDFKGSTSKFSTRDLKIFQGKTYSSSPDPVSYLSYRQDNKNWFLGSLPYFKVQGLNDRKPLDTARSERPLEVGVWISDWTQSRQSAQYQPVIYYTEATFRYVVFWTDLNYNGASSYALTFTGGGKGITRSANTVQNTTYTVDGNTVRGWWSGSNTIRVATSTSQSSGWVSESYRYFIPSGIKLDGKTVTLTSLTQASSHLYFWDIIYEYDRQPGV